MTHNIPLHILDEYAKTISANQVNMLYEHKFNKSFNKPLYEHLKYLNDNSHCVYLNDYTLEEAYSTVLDVLLNYVNKHNLLYNVVSDGIYLYTPVNEDYMSLLEHLVNDGFDIDTLKTIVEDLEATVFLEKLQAQ